MQLAPLCWPRDHRKSGSSWAKSHIGQTWTESGCRRASIFLLGVPELQERQRELLPQASW